MEDCFYLGEKETKKGMTEYFVFLGSKDNTVTRVFEAREELKGYLANRGTRHGLEPVVSFKPYNSNYRQQHVRWKVEAGECGSASESG